MDTGKKYDHGRYPIAITYTDNAYTAETDGKGNPIPFLINNSSGANGDIRVKLMDDTTFKDMFFHEGDNPNLVIAVSDQGGGITTSLFAVYPYKPCTTIINLTE